MQIFIRTNGRTAPVDATTPSELLGALSSTLGVSPGSLRLSHSSIPLDGRSTSSLDQLGVSPGATIDVDVRARGGAPKRRCAAWIGADKAGSPKERCNQAAMRIVGDCSFCTLSFCARHRLPEDHECAKMADVRGAAFERNKQKLESEMTQSKKIESM